MEYFRHKKTNSILMLKKRGDNFSMFYIMNDNLTHKKIFLKFSTKESRAKALCRNTNVYAAIL